MSVAVDVAEGTVTQIPQAEAWAEDIYATADLEDSRLDERLKKVAAAFAAKPLDSIPQACATPAEAKGAYRLIENDWVTAEKLKHPFADHTARCCAGEQLVLCLQDTTTLSLANLKETTGLGHITSHEGCQGLLVHSTLATNIAGVPIGLLDVQAWGRDPATKGRRHERKQHAIEEKENRKWLLGMRHSRQVVAANLEPEQRPTLVHVCDRESDVYEVLEEIAAAPGEEAVIRSKHNRRVQDNVKKAHAAVAGASLLGELEVPVPRKDKRPQRTARVQVRAITLQLKSPKPRPTEAQPLQLSLVWVYEPTPPKGVTGLDWKLWTTFPVTTLAEAMEIVRIYKCRWRIEDFHQILKSGCRIEKVQFDTAERIIKVLMIYATIAAGLLRLTHLVRQEPELPCTVALTENQWRALYTYIHKSPPASQEPAPTLYQAVMWIGRLGGHLGRKGDGMPGITTLWRGWRDLELLAAMYQALIPDRGG